MKRNFLSLFLLFLITSCAKSQLAEATWIDRADEKTLIHIEHDGGKSWARVEDRSGLWEPLEIAIQGGNTYLKYKNEKIPMEIRSDGTLLFRDREYILLSDSMKGRFTGRWQSEADGPAFEVRLDGNIDLTWDVIQEGEDPVRFWPKRTEKGFYFTRDHAVWSFYLEDGIMVDADGNRYRKISDI